MSKRATIVRAHGDSVVDARLLELVSNTMHVCAAAAQEGVNAVWSEAGFQAVTGRHQPRFGYKAWRAVHGSYPSTGAHLDSRASWLAAEIAMRMIRQIDHQRAQIESLLADPTAWPSGATRVEVRNARRSITRHTRETGAAPTSFFALRSVPARVPHHVLPLACTDHQFAEYTHVDLDEGVAKLRVKLAVTLEPVTRKDWEWHTIRVPLPVILLKRLRAGGTLSRPTLHISGSRVLADLITDITIPRTSPSPSRVVLGADWGERRLLTATDAWRAKDGSLRTSGQPVLFNSLGMQRKLTRVREHAYALQDKIKQYERLLAARPDQPALMMKRDRLISEREHIWARYQHASRQLAHAGARWLVEHAIAQGCDTIIIEDLRSLEARFPGQSSLNARINHQVRGRLFTALQHKTEAAGIHLITVHARGTSSTCGRCQSRVRHHAAPNTSTRGRGWGTCTGCHRTGDRDHLAAEHIALRGLADQHGLTRADGTREPGVQVRRSQRPRLKPTKRSSNTSTTTTSRSRARRVSPGRAVRTGGTPRTIDDIRRWPQRPNTGTQHTHHHALHGLINGYQTRIKATPTRGHRTILPPRKVQQDHFQ